MPGKSNRTRICHTCQRPGANRQGVRGEFYHLACLPGRRVVDDGSEYVVDDGSQYICEACALSRDDIAVRGDLGSAEFCPRCGKRLEDATAIAAPDGGRPTRG